MIQCKYLSLKDRVILPELKNYSLCVHITCLHISTDTHMLLSPVTCKSCSTLAIFDRYRDIQEFSTFCESLWPHSRESSQQPKNCSNMSLIPKTPEYTRTASSPKSTWAEAYIVQEVCIWTKPVI